MQADSPAAALFAVFYKHLFHELVDDEMGPGLASGFRAKANVSALMVRALIQHPESPWVDRTDTPEREDLPAILRRAFTAAVEELETRLGGEPRSWRWGRLHTLTLGHPLGSVPLLGRYFNLGPYPMPGHALTVFKQESRDDFRVHMGPSLRYVIDLGDLAHAEGVIPGGQSGVPASTHYADLFDLWRTGRYHPLLTDRSEIDAATEGRLILAPAAPR